MNIFKNKKCKVCKTKNEDVMFYEIGIKDTDKIIFKGNLCLKCVMIVASKAKSATIEFE